MKRIILTNQHVDNRGDESATIGAVRSLRKNFGQDTAITAYLQSGTKYKFLPDSYEVNGKPMIIAPLGILEMLIWVLFKLVRIDIRGICSRRLKEFIATHENADIVISSCGGPYIGDIYINHEFIHLLHLAIPLLLNRKTVFFAPSMGPFKNKFMNFFRKRILKQVGLIILRDSISFNYVKEFLPGQTNIYLTTDACLADDLGLEGIKKQPDTIGITPLDYNYPLSEDKFALKANYEKVIAGVLDNLMEGNRELRVEFFPQLFAKHTDVPFINKIIGMLKYPERAFIFSDQKSGRDQQLEIATLDFMIATRYHSAIFACKVNTPVVCIAYEHKLVAFMESANLSEYCLDIYKLDQAILLEKIASIEKNAQEIKDKMPPVMKKLNNLSNKTAELIYSYAKLGFVQPGINGM
jgi:colanic acid/amylovoran biosynthesis protein